MLKQNAIGASQCFKLFCCISRQRFTNRRSDMRSLATLAVFVAFVAVAAAQSAYYFTSNNTIPHFSSSECRIQGTRICDPENVLEGNSKSIAFWLLVIPTFEEFYLDAASLRSLYVKGESKRPVMGRLMILGTWLPMVTKN